jgi:hypothetical protein
MDCGVSSGGEWRRWSPGRGVASTRNHWDRVGEGMPVAKTRVAHPNQI